MEKTKPQSVQELREAIYIAANFKPTMRNFLPLEEILIQRSEIAKKILEADVLDNEDWIGMFHYCNEQIKKVIGIP